MSTPSDVWSRFSSDLLNRTIYEKSLTVNPEKRRERGSKIRAELNDARCRDREFGFTPSLLGNVSERLFIRSLGISNITFLIANSGPEPSLILGQSSRVALHAAKRNASYPLEDAMDKVVSMTGI